MERAEGKSDTMTETGRTYGMGWIHEYPDIRDYSPRHMNIAPLLEQLKMRVDERETIPSRSDLREWCPPVEDQMDLGSCTANAGVGMIEYFERRAYGKHVDASRLFLYKTTRNLLKKVGDTGADIRTTMGAMVLFGVPPESYWPYTTKAGMGGDGFDREPTAFCYAFSQAYRSIQYYKLDPPECSKAQVLSEIKSHLAAGFPSMFGFTVYSTIRVVSDTGRIPFPGPKESVEGGHAVLAVGYDDDLKIMNPETKAETTGALLIRNSWGDGWGEKGYGWLPYDYVLKGLAVDWWTLIKAEYLETGIFGL
jgi:C1A family cysteine protease